MRDFGVSYIAHGYVSAGTGDPETFVSSGPGYNDGRWHHVAFTRSRESGDIALFVALSMAAFAVLFGTRHIDATEHQDGLMLAIATESLVKLFAFVAVGVFVTFWIFDGPIALFEQAMSNPRTAAVLEREPQVATLVAMTLLSFVAIVMLPRQFHVTVVETLVSALRNVAVPGAVEPIGSAQMPKVLSE
mgnify:CR=1 FL=1